MNKSPQYNQRTERKQCKSEVEEIFVLHQKLAPSAAATKVYPKINSGFHARENPSFEATVSESSQIRELHETINF